MGDKASTVCEVLAEVGEEFVAKLPDPDVCAAFIFGSIAWGDADRSSDIDVMVCLDREDEFREVGRVRVADVLGRPVAGGPEFADVDRISWRRFERAARAGEWHHRIAHSIVVTDTTDSFEDLRATITADYTAELSRRQRAAARQDRSHAHLLDAGSSGRWSTDASLAALHVRLALEEAVGALVEAHGDRDSPAHFLDTVEQILVAVDRPDLFCRFVTALGLDHDGAAEQGMNAYRAFADALQRWAADPDIACGLTPEASAWVVFTYADETFEEIDHKLAAFRQLGNTAAMTAYVDRLLMTPIRMNAGTVLNLMVNGIAEMPSIPDFYRLLDDEPTLRQHWIRGLRLDNSPETVGGNVALVPELLNMIETVVLLGAERG